MNRQCLHVHIYLSLRHFRERLKLLSSIIISVICIGSHASDIGGLVGRHVPQNYEGQFRNKFSGRE